MRGRNAAFSFFAFLIIIYSGDVAIHGKGTLCTSAWEIFVEDRSASADVLFKSCIIGQRRGSGRKQIVDIPFFIEPLGIFKADVFLKVLTEEFLRVVVSLALSRLYNSISYILGEFNLETNGSVVAQRRLCVFLTENTLAFADPHTKIKDHHSVVFYFDRGTKARTLDTRFWRPRKKFQKPHKYLTFCILT